MVVGKPASAGGRPTASITYALNIIALVRLSSHQPTQAYAARRRAEGMSNLEIVRCLKRYIAHEIHHVLTA